MRGRELFLIGLLLAVLVIFGVGGVNASDSKNIDTGQMLKIFQEWQESKHPSTRLIFSGDIKLPDDAMCLACHDGAGFLQWSKKGFDPDFGDDAKLAELGPAPTAGCDVCHDANAKDSAKLRISGSTPDLKGGFKVADAGTGAVCILCHNSRRGMRNDKARPVTDKRAPHEASSADVIYGENFYFVPNAEIMPHADVENSCVGCHMSTEFNGGGHTFAASWDNCNSCHDGVDGQAEKNKVTAAQKALKSAIEVSVTKAAVAAMGKGGFAFKAVAEDESEDEKYTVIKKGKISNMNSVYFHGDQCFEFTVDGKKYLADINTIQCQGKDLLNTKEGQIIAKAGWNLYLIDHDRSHGAHNSPYVLAAVKATVEALEAVDYTKMSAL